MISVLILTKNEEVDLPSCLASLSWCDDVHVYDSFSTDRTPQIALAAGARLYQRVFDDYASQRNAALAEVPFRHEWILILDADERPSPELSAEMLLAVATVAPDTNAFRLIRRDYFWGTWLRHAQITPWYIRLIRRGHAHYTRAINEVLEVDGKVQGLTQPLFHYPFSKGISYWVRRHDIYSTLEANLIHQRGGLQNPSWNKALFARDISERRLHQKAIFYRLPGRSLVKLAYMLFVRRAILDGSAGIRYALLQSIYEYLIVLKTQELERIDTHGLAEVAASEQNGKQNPETAAGDAQTNQK
jgi:glycosyltransferase involved in cell wall biosynthesis